MIAIYHSCDQLVAFPSSCHRVHTQNIDRLGLSNLMARPPETDDLCRLIGWIDLEGF